MAFASSVENSRKMNCNMCSESSGDLRSLNCKHTFCKRCIKSLVLRQLEGCESKNKTPIIECTVCGEVTKLPTGEFDTVAWISKPDQASSEIESASSSDDVTEMCEPCSQENVTKTADVCCLDCTEYQCNDCNKTHQNLKATRSHRVVKLGQVGDELDTKAVKTFQKLLRCEEHESKPIEFFCKDCDILCCSTCAFVIHRLCAEVVDIKDGSEFENTENAITYKGDQNLLKTLEDVINIQVKYNARVWDDYVTVRSKLETATEAFIARIQKAKKVILSGCKSRCDKLKETNDEKLETVKSLKVEVQDSIKVMQTMATIGVSEKEKSISMKRLEEKREQLNEKAAKTIQECREQFRSVALQDSHDFARILETTDIFGEVVQCDVDMEVPTLLKNLDFEDKTLVQNKRLAHAAEKIALKGSFFTSCFFEWQKGETCIFADNARKRLVLFNTSSGVVSEHKTKSAAYMVRFQEDTGQIAVSFPIEKKISIYDANMTLVKDIKTKHQCCAFIMTPGSVVVGVCGKRGVNSLVTYSIADGTEISVMTSDSNGRRFNSMQNFLILNSVVYQSCEESNIVFTFNVDNGEPVQEYKHEKLIWPAGLDTDNEDRLYVCGLKSHNIHVFAISGEHVRIFDLGPDISPVAISYSQNNEDIAIVGDANNPGPFFFALK